MTGRRRACTLARMVTTLASFALWSIAGISATTIALQAYAFVTGARTRSPLDLTETRLALAWIAAALLGLTWLSTAAA